MAFRFITATPMRTPRYEDRADNDLDADRQPDPRQMFSVLNKSLALCDLHQHERVEVEVDPVWSVRGPRHHATRQAQTWRCDAVENGGILRFLRIIDDMVSRLWQFPAGHDGHGTAPFNI